jgi:hypothetical protein
MPAPQEPSRTKKQATDDVQAVLEQSAQGASILISLQVGSRALTFVVNQVLIRFLSPELLGISARFELFNISVLTFCRESIRIALGRQGSPSKQTRKAEESRDAVRYEPARRAQGAINLSYVAIALGPFFSLVFTWFLFWRHPDPISNAVPFYRDAQVTYVVATMLELWSEPCFSIAAQQSLYRLRATAETAAAVARAVVSCALAFASNQFDLGLGALPFAAGQLSFALMMNLVYYWGVIPRAASDGYAVLPKPVPLPTEEYAFGYVRRSAARLAQNLYTQSGLKFLLTQGDSYVMASFASTATLGVYSLATNYGALLARMVFQPIEESSRGVFGGLLAHYTNKEVVPDPTKGEDSDEQPAANGTEKTPPPTAIDPKLRSARDYLVTVLRLYSLMSLGLMSLLPGFAPMLLSIVAGSRWAATEAPDVLGIYAYYLPLLAFNGILEAFVAATASPVQLQKQNQAMIGFTVTFLGAAYMIVGRGNGGAMGVVAANAVNMSMRIIWSYRFVSQWFAERACPLELSDFVPRAFVVALGLATTAALQRVGNQHASLGQGPLSLTEVAKMVGIGGAYGLFLLFTQRKFLADCYRLLRPKAAAPASDATQTKKTS